MNLAPSQIGTRAEAAVAAALATCLAPTPGEIDHFGVYSPDLHQVFMVPNVGLPERKATLRLENTRNNQRAGLRWARDYAVDVALPLVAPGNPAEWLGGDP